MERTQCPRMTERGHRGRWCLKRRESNRRTRGVRETRWDTTMSVLPEVLKANAGYAATLGAKGKLTIPPARHCTILTCMDARLDPAKYAGLAEGETHVIRNAGGHITPPD